MRTDTGKRERAAFRKVDRDEFMENIACVEIWEKSTERVLGCPPGDCINGSRQGSASTS